MGFCAELLYAVDFIYQDVNRDLSRHKLMEETAHEGGDPMVHGESGESSLSSIPFQVPFEFQSPGSFDLMMFDGF